MSRHFITFKPSTGIYKQAIQRYKKVFELTDMSPLIEIDQRKYRILRTTGIFNRVNTRKVVVANEAGELIEDEKITRKCANIFFYLNVFHANDQGIIASSNEEIIIKLDKIIIEFKKTIKNLTPHVTTIELEAMKKHLDYYIKVKHLYKNVVKAASQLIPYIKPLKENTLDLLSSSFIKKIAIHINQWELNKRYIEVTMIEDNDSRNIVKAVLENEDYQEYFSDEEIIEQMIQEVYASEKAVNQFILAGETGWKREVHWLNPDKGKFTVEKYLQDLRSGNYVAVFKEVNANEFIDNHWVF